MFLFQQPCHDEEHFHKMSHGQQVSFLLELHLLSDFDTVSLCYKINLLLLGYKRKHTAVR